MMDFDISDAMTVDEVAALFRKRPGTIRGWVRSGILVGGPTGPFDNSKILISRESVLQLARELAERRSKLN